MSYIVSILVEMSSLYQGLFKNAGVKPKNFLYGK
jgi:hypothetical protein